MKDTFIENYITSYDDMIYESGPNTFNNFISDKYNKVHNELYNDALQKYYNHILDLNISIAFLYELLIAIYENNEYEKLYDIIKNTEYLSNANNGLISLCGNSNEFVYELYKIIINDYLSSLKAQLINELIIVEDFLHMHIEHSILDNLIVYALNLNKEVIELHYFNEYDMNNYIFIFGNNNGVRIGFDKFGEWIIICEETIEIERIKSILINLSKSNNVFLKKIKNIVKENFKHNHKVIEIKNSEYWMPSSIYIIYNTMPYKKSFINLEKWWNSNYNKDNYEELSFNDIKVTLENISDSEVIELNYILGKAKLYSKNADLTFEVPFRYLNENNILNDDMLLTNIFRGNL